MAEKLLKNSFVDENTGGGDVYLINTQNRGDIWQTINPNLPGKIGIFLQVLAFIKLMN
ncbi:MAG: hypothetical protein M3015_03065 [Bacteroidota bacterium]|nr:hypothetical protein [Bacteroidota bacterium]